MPYVRSARTRYKMGKGENLRELQNDLSDRIPDLKSRLISFDTLKFSRQWCSLDKLSSSEICHDRKVKCLPRKIRAVCRLK